MIWHLSSARLMTGPTWGGARSLRACRRGRKPQDHAPHGRHRAEKGDVVLVDQRPEPWESWHCLAVYKMRNSLLGTFEPKLWRTRLAEKIGPENNPGILENRKKCQEAAAKKLRR